MTINDEKEFQQKLEKLMDNDRCYYIRIEEQGRFAVTSNILFIEKLKNKQNITFDRFRSIIQIHERELLSLQTRLRRNHCD